MEWYPILTRTGREHVAGDILRNKLFTTSVPTLREQRGKSVRRVPLFPSYLFVMGEVPWEFCNEEHPHCIRDRKGRRILYGPLMFGKRLASLHDHEIEHITLMAQILDNEFKREDADKPSLEVGQFGIIKSGPFEGKQGEIVAINGEDAKVAMRIFGSLRALRVKLGSLEAA